MLDFNDSFDLSCLRLPHAFLISFLLPASLTLSFLLFRQLQSKNPSLIPSPWRLPLIGNLHQLGSLPHRCLHTLSQKHGPVMLLHLGRVPTVIVSSAAGAQEIMKTRDLAFASRPNSSMGDILMYGSKDISLCKYGEYWRKLRYVCVVHLLNLRQVHAFRRIRVEEVALLVDKIRAATGPLNVSEMLVTLTTDIICRVALGKKYYTEESGGRSGFRKLFSEWMALLGSFPVRDHVPTLGWVDWLSGLDERARKTANELDAFVEEVFEAHASKEEQDNDSDNSSVDFVDILLSLGTDNKDNTQGISLSRDSIKAVILDMFGGGADTTYATIEWVMEELVKHPAKMERVQKEIRSIAGSKGEIGEEIVEEMEYLKAVIMETLRLHPPAPLLIPRESTEETQLQGFCIPKGTRIIINAWAIARDAVSWEKAEEFWPERFLQADQRNVDFKGQVDFKLIPFGGGRRGCPGIHFAFPVIKLALSNLLYHFNWELPQGEEMDVSEYFGLVVHKKASLILLQKNPKAN